MQIARRFTVAGRDPFSAFTFVARTSRIANPDGTVVFEMKDILAPEHWSQVAVDVLAQKYFRKAGVAAQLQKVHEENVPEWLQRARPAEGDACLGQETDARQVFERQTVDALVDAIQRFESGRYRFEPKALRLRAEAFDRGLFKERVHVYLAERLREHRGC